MEYHYTYKLTCDQTQQYYYGVRTSKQICEEDPYMSSSRVVRAMRSQGYTFNKSLIAYHSSRNAACQHERELLENENTISDYNLLNLSKPSNTTHQWGVAPWNKGLKIGIGGNTSKRSLETLNKMSAGRKGKSNPKCSCIECSVILPNNRISAHKCKRK